MNTSPETAPLTIVSLPNSERAAQTILRLADPLKTDEACQARFYGELGVVPTVLQPGGEIGDCPIYYKDETVQDSGSYKRRGATYAATLSGDDVIAAYSTGNHGLALAYAGARLDKEVRIALPEDVSLAKRIRLEQTDAKLFYFDDFTEAQQAVAEWETESGVAVIKPFGQHTVIAGQCSAGYELVDNLVRLGLTHEEVVVPVPVAGGGYISGFALPLWEARRRGVIGPHVRVVGVQPEHTDALGRAVQHVRANRQPQRLFEGDELDKDCDALAITEENLSALTLAIAADRRFVSSFHTVGKLALAKARRNLSDQLGKEVEPAAALPLAYAMAHARAGTTFVLPISGSNISVETRKLYDGLIVADNVAQFQARSAAQFKRSERDPRHAGFDTISLDRTSRLGFSPVTRRHVLSTAERRKEVRKSR
ncbi:MAG TPA: pyridoxal-phosphate dependent enzyme [Candidatus Saccharimonadales bacterium]|nr:pyridoxal-phosphate dependent enzyme [Candidatus Saccharimonadales bacterium]